MRPFPARWLARTDRFWAYLLGGGLPPARRAARPGVTALEDRLVPDGRCRTR